MKLRFEDNSLRLRLSETEVQEFAATGRVESAVSFGPAQRLTYALERRAGLAAVQVSFAGHALTVQVPAALADAWAGTEQNGFAETLTVAAGPPLRVLVEKDLPCRH